MNYKLVLISLTLLLLPHLISCGKQNGKVIPDKIQIHNSSFTQQVKIDGLIVNPNSTVSIPVNYKGDPLRGSLTLLTRNRTYYLTFPTYSFWREKEDKTETTAYLDFNTMKFMALSENQLTPRGGFDLISIHNDAKKKITVIHDGCSPINLNAGDSIDILTQTQGHHVSQKEEAGELILSTRTKSYKLRIQKRRYFKDNTGMRKTTLKMKTIEWLHKGISLQEFVKADFSLIASSASASSTTTSLLKSDQRKKICCLIQ